MPRGVHVFGVIQDKHINESWVRSVLGISRYRYRRLRVGEALFTPEEVDILVSAMKNTYNISRGRLFDKDAEVLPPGRRRRSKGTVTTTKTTKGNAA